MGICAWVLTYRIPIRRLLCRVDVLIFLTCVWRALVVLSGAAYPVQYTCMLYGIESHVHMCKIYGETLWVVCVY
jgi:hypothetical protein